jgi:hypothetical protein
LPSEARKCDRFFELFPARLGFTRLGMLQTVKQRLPEILAKVAAAAVAEAGGSWWKLRC